MIALATQVVSEPVIVAVPYGDGLRISRMYGILIRTMPLRVVCVYVCIELGAIGGGEKDTEDLSDLKRTVIAL